MTTPVGFNRTRVIRRSILSFAAFVVVALPVAGIAPTAQQANAANSSDSATTVTVGDGYFKGLKVTVSQTTDLVNQVVDVTWQSPVGANGPIAQYVQIMQCWGDSSQGPSRENCEYGANFAAGKGGQWGSTRTVGGMDSIQRDTLEAPGAGSIGFSPVDGSSGAPGDYYDANTTNEINFARTYADGSGDILFNTQTGIEAPGLGCGLTVTDVSTNKSARHGCWLVVVPRADHELTPSEVAQGGFVVSPGQPAGVNSSPLSATNFTNSAVSIPLQFQPIGAACDITKHSIPTYGTELMTGAMTSWEAGLCSATPYVYGFSQVSDDLARNQIAGGDQGLGFVGRPIPAAQLPAKAIYSPVGISAVGIGFLVERQPSSQATPEELALVSKAIQSIKLTPRLVAKLLTQSYRVGAAISDPKLSSTAYSLTSDPEFLAINPDFAHLQYNPGIGDVLMPYVPSDSAKLLWTWVNSDANARAFLDGQPDNDSMQGGKIKKPTYVNPAYKGLSLPLTTYPKQDSYCVEQQYLPPLCTLDAHPYVNTMVDVANSISRGDTQARTSFNGISWGKTTPQAIGSRDLMGITDTASAARYGVTMASLENANGEFVSPTSDAMLAAVNAMKTDPASGTLIPDPETKAAGAYPLTEVSYAVVIPSLLKQPLLTQYSKVLSYAATAGQQQGVKPGQLPLGYVPLTAALATQAAQAASDLAAAATPSPTPSATPTATPTPTPTVTASAYPTTSPSSGGLPIPTSVPTSTSSQPVSQPTATPTSPVLVATVTPALGAGTGTYVIAGALILGALAALGGPLVSWLAAKGRL